MAMSTYDALRLDGIQLVDARLLLKMLERKNETDKRCALFLMKIFDDKKKLDDEEKKHIRGCMENEPRWSPKDMKFGMNCRE